MKLGEAIIVYVRDPSVDFETGFPLLHPRFETIEGEKYVVGETPSLAGDWTAGVLAGVNWKEVQNFLSFASAQDMAERAARERERERKQEPRN